MNHSILIPYLGNTAAFESTLASVLREQGPGQEVIVCHHDDYLDQHGIGDEVRFVQATDENWDELFRAGVKEAHGKWIGWIWPGIEPKDNGLQNCFRAIAKSNLLCVAPRLEIDRSIFTGMNHSWNFRLRLTKSNKSKSAIPSRFASFWNRELTAEILECIEPKHTRSTLDFQLGQLIQSNAILDDTHFVSNVPAEDLELALNVTGYQAQTLLQKYAAGNSPLRCIKSVLAVACEPFSRFKSLGSILGRGIAIFNQARNRKYAEHCTHLVQSLLERREGNQPLPTTSQPLRRAA